MANLISKLNVGGVLYDLKDAEARAKLVILLGDKYETLSEELGAAAWRAVAANISDTTGAIADAKTVKDYVDAQVGAIHNFDVVIDNDGTEAGPSVTASADTMYKIYLVPDTDAEAGSYIEWITVRSGADPDYTYTWEAIGSTKTSLDGYVPNTRKIAGIALSADISVADLQNALNLKALAYKDSATGTVAAQTITGVDATGTSTGSLSGDIAYTSTAVSSTGKFTPSGSISGSAISDGSITVTLKDATSATAATVTASAYTPAGSVATELTQSASGAFQVSGTVSAPTVTVSPSTGTVKGMKTSGTAYSITDGSVSKGDDTTSAFATEGLKASVADETLTFTAAGTAQAVTAAGSVTYTAPVLSGALPTFEDTNVVVGIASATATAPTFTGEKYDISSTFTGTAEDNVKVTSVTYKKQEVDTQNFTGTPASLGFTGSEGDVSVSGNYDKANKGTLAFKGEDITLNVGDITVAAKDVTVQ